MPLVTYSIPNLLNGVSQQAPALRRKTQAALMDNGWASVVDGLQKRPPIETISKVNTSTDLSSSFIHAINRDTTERYIAVFGPSAIEVFGVDGTTYQVETPNGLSYLPSDPSTQLRVLTVDDYSFVVNTQTTMAMSGTTPTTPNPKAFIEVRAANYSMDYEIYIDGTLAAQLTTDSTTPYNQTSTIAEDLKDGTVSGSATSSTDLDAWRLLQATPADWTITISGNTIVIENVNGDDFTVDVTDGAADTAILATKGYAERFTDLPIRAEHDTSVEVRAEPESSAGSYWVKFERPDAASGIGEGQWIESVDPTLDNAYDASTMPHVLVRRFDDASGTITGTANQAYFSFEEWTWTDRSVGDANTNPNPSFIGTTARDLFFFRDRLGILTPGEVVLSEAGFYGNFYRTTVTTLIDSDVVDLSISDVQVSDMQWAVPDEQDLILFSDQTQYVFETNGPLTPNSGSIKATTRYESSRAARPLLVGDKVLFAQQNGNYVGIREYYVNPDTQKRVAEEATGHVDRYIEGTLRDMTASAQQRALIVATRGSRYVYLFQWFDERSNRLQAAWSRWDLGLGDSLLGLRFIDTTLYFVSQRDDGVYLEKIETDPGRTDDLSGIRVYLDRRIDLEDAVKYYDTGTSQTIITIPTPCDPTTPTVITGSPDDLPDPGGDPDFDGTYYDIERCDDSGQAISAYVQGDEFSTNDVFMKNGVCYKVLATSPSPDPELTSVIRSSSVTDYADCTACQAVQDVDAAEPPITATSFLRMARCNDDTMGDYSIPEQLMGIPVAEDLTKIFEFGGICYYVTNVREAFPSDPLFPVHNANQHDTCEDCFADPCVDCDNNTYSDPAEYPNDAVVSDLADLDCYDTDTYGAIGDLEFILYSETAAYCYWLWEDPGAGATAFELWYAKPGGGGTSIPAAGTCGPLVLAEGEYGAWLDADDTNGATGGDWMEKVTGFSCNATTHRMYGSHTFGAKCDGVAGCDANPTVTVAP